MNRCIRALAALATVTAAVAVTVVAGGLSGAALASPNPLLADPAAKGYVGLCNQAGQNVTGGSIDTKPFIWKAVASVAPPSAYQGRGQNSVLGILQPRSGTAASEWGGTSLTAPSYYRQRQTPAAQATYADQSLRSVISNYPPRVDGLYVLRMYFGRAGYGTYNSSYPSTTIQVDGSSWRVVRGGTVDCHRASAVSNEQLTGVAAANATTPHRPSSADRTVSSQRARTIAAPARRTRSGGVNTVDRSAGNASSRSPGSAGTPDNAVPASDTSHPSSPSWVVWLLVSIVVVLVLALGAVLRTRHSTPHAFPTEKDPTQP